MNTSTGTTPKHVFLHLLLIAMLYATVIATLALLFNYTNYVFFDSAFDYKASILDGVRWASSVLLVSFPVLVLLSWFVGKELKQNEAVRLLKTRRWLLYFTQFATALTIIIDLMTLIYNFYGGDLTLRFITKVVIVLVVAALVLGYYHWELKRTDYNSVFPKVTAIVAGVVLFSCLVAGFFITGTPMQQRAVKLDDQRLQDLANLQSQVLAFTDNAGHMPTTVELTDYLGGLPTDPVTAEPYTYTIISEEDGAFKLCATFDTEALDREPLNWGYDLTYPTKGTRIIGNQSWKHSKGNDCFERAITVDVPTPSVTNVNTNANTNTAVDLPFQAREVTLYYSDPQARGTGEVIGCGDTVSTVTTTIAAEGDSVELALTALFAGEGDSSTDHYNPFFYSDLKVEDVSYAKGIGIVHLSGQLVFNGECDIPRIEESLHRTITQFDGVIESQVFVNGKLLEDELSLQG